VNASAAPTPSAQTPGCRVELLGPARLISGTRWVDLDIRSETSVSGVIAMLLEACPGLDGAVIDVERQRLVSGYVLNRNGREFLIAADACVWPGDHLLLLSSVAGG